MALVEVCQKHGERDIPISRRHQFGRLLTIGESDFVLGQLRDAIALTSAGYPDRPRNRDSKHTNDVGAGKMGKA